MYYNIAMFQRCNSDLLLHVTDQTLRSRLFQNHLGFSDGIISVHEDFDPSQIVIAGEDNQVAIE